MSNVVFGFVWYENTASEWIRAKHDRWEPSKTSLVALESFFHIKRLSLNDEKWKIPQRRRQIAREAPTRSLNFLNSSLHFSLRLMNIQMILFTISFVAFIFHLCLWRSILTPPRVQTSSSYLSLCCWWIKNWSKFSRKISHFHSPPHTLTLLSAHRQLVSARFRKFSFTRSIKISWKIYRFHHKISRHLSFHFTSTRTISDVYLVSRLSCAGEKHFLLSEYSSPRLIVENSGRLTNWYLILFSSHSVWDVSFHFFNWPCHMRWTRLDKVRKRVVDFKRQPSAAMSYFLNHKTALTMLKLLITMLFEVSWFINCNCVAMNYRKNIVIVERENPFSVNFTSSAVVTTIFHQELVGQFSRPLIT